MTRGYNVSNFVWLCVDMHARKRGEGVCDLHVCVCLCSSSLFLHRGFGICLLWWRLINVTSFCLKIIKCQVLQWQQNVLAESQWREVVRVCACLCVCCTGANTSAVSFSVRSVFHLHYVKWNCQWTSCTARSVVKIGKDSCTETSELASGGRQQGDIANKCRTRKCLHDSHREFEKCARIQSDRAICKTCQFSL